jgi:hypothetical protein
MGGISVQHSCCGLKKGSCLANARPTCRDTLTLLHPPQHLKMNVSKGKLGVSATNFKLSLLAREQGGTNSTQLEAATTRPSNRP